MGDRVMHFVPYFPPHSGGLEMYAKEWVENFVQGYGDAAIVTFSVGQDEGNRIQDGYQVIVIPAFDIVHSFPFPKFWLPSFWKSLAQARKWNPTVVHTHTRFFISSLLGGIFARVVRKKWIHIEHGSGLVVSENFLVKYLSRLYDYTLGKCVLKWADSIITVSQSCEMFVRQFALIKRVTTIYRGITFPTSNIQRSTDEILIGYAGRLVDLKGVDLLITAFKDYQKDYRGLKNLRLIIAGDGPERKKLEKLSENTTLPESIEFLGQKSSEYIREVFLPSVHIFVNPSLQEGLPTSVMEALVAGCSVIATDVGGTRELLQYNDFILVQPSSSESLHAALERGVGILVNSHKGNVKNELFQWKDTFLQFQMLYTKK